MLTTVANSLFDRLIEAFPPNRPYGRKEFRRDPMPEPVGAYLAHLLEMKLHELIDGDPPDDAWVDMYASDVKEARSVYLAALERHQAIPALEWADALRTACRDTLRYLIRPAATLTDAVFASGPASVRASEVFVRVDFYAPYAYFRSVIEAYFEQKEALRIDRDRFEGLVRRTDRQMTSDFSPEQWRRLLDPLVDVLTSAGMTEVPLEMLKTFLQEKGADGPLRRMKQRHGLEGFVPFGEFEDLFVTEEPTAEIPEAEPTVEQRSKAGPRGESVPLWKQFEHGYQPPSEEPERQPADANNGSSEPLWKQFRKEPERPRRVGAASLPDLERAVLGDRGARNRDLFVKHLFSGRRDEYESTLRRLAQAASWSQASQIIAQEVFLKHQVNIYSDPAVAFTDAAEAQYRS